MPIYLDNMYLLAFAYSVVVEYEPTEYIDSLRGVIEALSAFGKSHKEKSQAEG